MLEARAQSEVKSQKPKAKKAEGGGAKAEAGCQKSEVRRERDRVSGESVELVESVDGSLLVGPGHSGFQIGAATVGQCVHRPSLVADGFIILDCRIAKPRGSS